MCATTYTGFYPRTQERSRNNSASSHKKSAMMNMDIPRTSRFSVLPENENVDPKHLRRIREACLKESSVIIENEYLRVEVNHELESHFEASSFPDIKFYIKYYNKFKYPLENFEIIQLQIPGKTTLNFLLIGFIIIGEEKPGSLLKTGQSQHHLLKLRFKTLDPKMASFTINFR